MKTLIEIRQIEKPLTGNRFEFVVDGLKNIEVAEIYANLMAARQSALDGDAYYVHSIVMNTENCVFNPTPDYWDFCKLPVEITHLGPATVTDVSGFHRKKSVTF